METAFFCFLASLTECAWSELHPRSGLGMLTRRIEIVLVFVLVLVLESGRAG
jgi:hypothetical protein